MKKILLLVMLLFTLQTHAQFDNNLNPGEGMLDGGVGMSWIDGQPNYTVRLRPELAFGKFGAGLDLNLEFNSHGLRTENFNTASDYLAIIRYLRWGHKNDPLYIRVGALDMTTLGYGNLVPYGTFSEVLVSIQSVMGFIIFAVLAGIFSSIVLDRIKD